MPPEGDDLVTTPATSRIRRTDRALIKLSAVVAGAAVLTQIAYPLVDGNPDAATNPALVTVTVVSVLLFATACVLHSAATLGPVAAAAVLLLPAGIGFASEALGVATGYPFGHYGYADTLGPKLLDVPILVPLAWVMMAYPCLLAGRAVARGRRGGALVAVVASGWLLASWDLFLDPQMVTAGHWRWAFPEPHLPAVPGVPLTNYAGWLLVALLIQTALHATVPDSGRRPVAVPAVLLTWTWLGSTVANLAFFGRPAVALYGFVAMGVVTLPALVRWRRR